jgi:mRNA interferase RelE/StbE
MSYSLEWTDDSSRDYDNLDGSQKLFVNKALARIKSLGMEAGQPLHGALVGCNKLKHKKLGLRVIFRKSSKGIRIIQIVAIGKRADGEIYAIAKHRL